MSNTIRGMDRGELISESTHARELLEAGSIEEARSLVKTLCMGLAEHTPQLDGENVTREIVERYLSGIESLLVPETV